MNRNWKLAASGLLLLALTALPAFASYVVLKDQFNPKSGTGIVLIQLEPMRFAEIWYRDTDASQSYTDGDRHMRVRYFREAPGPVVLQRAK